MSTNTAAGPAPAMGSARPSAAAAAGSSTLDVGGLVNHTVIVLLALVALVFLFRIPRAFARLWRVSEWTRGHFLGYAPHTGPSLSTGVSFPDPGLTASGHTKDMDSSQDSHTTYDLKFVNLKAVRSRESIGPYPPPHMEPTPSLLRPVVSLLRSRVAPGFSAAQLVVCMGYLGVLLYPSIYMSRGPFIDISRYGYIATSQIPWIFAFGAKNNSLGMLFGMGYEKLNFLHRFVARLAIISANLHSFGYIYKWCIAKTFMEDISKPQMYFGLCALLSFNLLLLTSSAYVRKNGYNIFFYSHVLFFHTAVIGAFYHCPQMMPYLYATFAIYGLDKLLRLAKTRISTATIRPIPELGLTRIEIPYINKGWRAGQHVRIQVLSRALGNTGWAQVHPFTIASESNSQEGMVLMCKKTGTWTQKLFATAAVGQPEQGVGRNVKIVVEGPYGGPGFAMFNSYSASVFIAGGSGITFALSAVQELIQRDLRGESRVRVIELVWVAQDAASLVPLIPQFTAMIQQSVYARLSIRVHYTKAVVGKIRLNSALPPGLSLNAGRPRFLSVIESTISLAVNTGNSENCGMIVGVCGPVGLGDDIIRAVGLVDPVKRDRIGGIEVHEETFGW
ncbi:hypothetical protein DFH07DRAFT_555851 [Mycena maculata]|uniref:ferric-chelate reductase (NADPH) n=1 Tax=Mycena maculata TaxID=230809 RepID=A0AAD7IUW4_9AGAR|nr:hypothetical protein DFH07DRAFT_555851 [Mycena maculata]